MKKNPLPLLLAVIATVLGLGLLFTGCERNEASQNATLTEDQVSRTLAERERELIEREIALNERVEIVEQREGELAEKEEAARIVTLMLPAATELELEILDPVSTGANLVGDPVRAVVVRDVLQDGLIAVPAGSRVFGSVESLVAARKIGGQALLTIRFDELELVSGELVPISAFLDTAGRDQKKNDAATIGGSVAGGALLGRILSKDDKTKGTVLGAVLGAAVGTAVASSNLNDPVEIAAGDLMAVRLDRAVEISVETFN